MSERPHDTFAEDDDRPVLPKAIGRYQIQRLLGAGGMATVYAALQESPRRTVALKVMRPGIASRSTLRRFKHEAEILAKLRHPYIAQIYEAGTHDDGGGGVPYFVMEYIPGASGLVEFADAKELDVRERLKLFVKVCAAVQHGHAMGIVHRDLKPGNILVDAKGDPKVIDYGVARATETDLVQNTQVTDAGRLVGTVLYMSPEQVEGTNTDISAACDAYALGVVLYRLLCGRMPYSLAGMPLFEAVRVIREDMPTRPSSIKPELRGDLETIMLKALEKDRARRYRDAGELGRDLLRYLGDQPIKARRTGLVHRARLFARRHRAGVIATAIALVAITALAAGGAGLWWKYGEVERERTEAAAARTAQDEEARALAAAAQVPVAEPERRDRIVLRAHDGAVLDVVFAAGSGLAATSSTDGKVVLWDLESATRRLEFAADEHLSGPIAIDAAGDRAVAARTDGTIAVLDLVGGEVAPAPVRHTAACTSVALSSDGQVLVSASDDATVRVYRFGHDEERTLRGTIGVFRVVALASDARTIVAGTDRGTVVRWRLPVERSRRPIAIDRSPVRAIALSPDGLMVAAGTDSGRLQLQKRAGEEGEADAVWTIGAHDGPVTAVTIHPNGKRVATASSDGTVKLWDAADGKVLDVYDHTVRSADGTVQPVPVWSLAFDPTGKWLALGDDEGMLVALPFEESENKVVWER
ncbi:MAG: protein kinase [Phycisphaerales bacterium]|nr:protein kinase [Phycisphaerales bacterium]